MKPTILNILKYLIVLFSNLVITNENSSPALGSTGVPWAFVLLAVQ